MALVGASPIDPREGAVHEGCVIEVRLCGSPSPCSALDRAVVATMAVVRKKGLDVLPLGGRPGWAGGETWVGLELAARHDQN